MVENTIGGLNWIKETVVYPIVHDVDEVKQLERAANFSGRDECFFVGRIAPAACCSSDYFVQVKANQPAVIDGPVYHVDCNSLYPYVMREHKYPYSLVGWQREATARLLQDLATQYCVIASVLVETGSEPFPVRHKDRTIHALGKFWTTLTGAQLRYALSMDLVKSVGLHAAYKERPLFLEYVETLYALKTRYKTDGNAAYYSITKALLNSLYGKFAQRPRRWIEAEYDNPPYRWGTWPLCDGDSNKVTWYRSIAGKVQRQDVVGELHHSFPAIPAVVTSYARLYMDSVRHICGRENVLYQGTDSLILLEPGYRLLLQHGMISDTKLGHFRLEGIYDTGEIRNNQDYHLGTERHVRGLPQGAIEESRGI